MSRDNEQKFEIVANTPHELIFDTMNVFNPSKITTIEDATAFLSNMNTVAEATNLRAYRAIYVVYRDKLYTKATYVKGRETRYCATIAEYGENVVNPPLKKSQIYNAVKVGSLITDDGNGTIFDTENDRFTFTQLVAIIESGKDKLYTTDKSGAFTWAMCDEIEHDTDANGNVRMVYYKGAPAFAYVYTGKQVRTIDLLISLGYINAGLSAKKIAWLIKRDFVIGEYGINDKDFYTAEADTAEADTAEADTAEADTADTDDTADTKGKTKLSTDSIAITMERSEWVFIAKVLAAANVANADKVAKEIEKLIK